MKRITLLMVLMAFGIILSAQITPTCYRLSLSDKNNSPYSINDPSAYLSERALAKRARFSIPITEQDFPVNPQYLQAIKAIDTSIRVLCTSKWMNTATIYCPDSTKLPQVQALAFVTDILPVAAYNLSSLHGNAEPEGHIHSSIVANPAKDSVMFYDYGTGAAQIALHNGHLLHNVGYRGDGMLIAVFDAGWDGVDTSIFFRHIFESGRLVGTRDLLPWADNVYAGHHHGTLVTSTMAAMTEGVFVGTAPEASYYLIRSEEPNMEQLIEEDFWAQAAEIADSLGADVINSSLGYTEFADFPQGNYTYEAMDGVTSIASRAATILGQKGVVVCISAGNEGAHEWHYIGHPSDAFDVLAVGAADTAGNIAPFSSRGPSYDGRVKPDITSVGVNTACFWPGDYLGTADGTSLAGPVAAGLCACLWQALPNYSAVQLMQIIRESGSCYSNPNDSLGYGIPDFYAAYRLHQADAVTDYVPTRIEVFPNPCVDFVKIPNRMQDIQHIDIYSLDGKLIMQNDPSPDYFITLDVSRLPKGMYLGKVRLASGRTQTFKLVK
ncbi:MAG: S8 family peptidase [Bacteroidales bacterium]|nr:S8 family peptidase [Bacteroidales bacterium]